MLDMRKTINIKEAAFVLGLSATFLVVALLAFSFLMITLILVVLGFTGIGGTAAAIAKILLLVFFVLLVISLILGRRGVE
jgi:uncharacterized membrane protein YtjA (UPF0391 family)